MKLIKFISIIFIVLQIVKGDDVPNENSFENRIIFEENSECKSPKENSTKFAIIIHGWHETCKTNWVKTLTKNLEKYRGGCVICMDYGFFAKWNYFLLIKYKNIIAKVLATKLRHLESLDFDPDEGFIFGFSLGGRIAITAGRMFGKGKLAEIDICDMAGPGFDKFELDDPKEAAQNVQCIHTSFGKGTIQRNCHQNWNMGICGAFQIAAGAPPRGAHGLCPIFYNSAFENNFYAETTPYQCAIGKIQRYWPKKFKMGYMERRKFKVRGLFFSSTTQEYPYTLQSFKKKQLTQPNKEFALYVNGQKYSF